MKKVPKWLVVLILINLVDYFLTLALINTGLTTEWNPFLNAITEPGRTFFKLAWPTLSGVFFYTAGSQRVFGFSTSSILKVTSLLFCLIVVLYSIGGISSFLIGYYF